MPNLQFVQILEVTVRWFTPLLLVLDAPAPLTRVVCNCATGNDHFCNRGISLQPDTVQMFGNPAVQGCEKKAQRFKSNTGIRYLIAVHAEFCT